MMAKLVILGLFLSLTLSVWAQTNEYDEQVNLEAEEARAGRRFLGKISDEANLSNYFDDLNSVVYSILKNKYSHFFEIELNSDFYINKTIDREEFCAKKETCDLPVDLWATAGAIVVSINVVVDIIDENDNRPRFTQTRKDLSIPELTQPGAVYELPIAEDLDSPKFGIVAYNLSSVDPNITNSFTLEVTTKVDGTQVLNLIINITLDRETKAYYELFVKAIDGGQKTDQLTVNIEVTDINDNQPVFSKSEYNVSMDEDIGVGKPIINVTAVDRDIGENARLSYSITSYDPDSISNSIAIQTDTGMIFVTDTIDSTSDVFILFVEAKDHGNPQKTSELSKVTINVRDKNDNAPQIQITLVNNGRIYENTENGTLVAHVRVTDDDKGLNAEAGCTCDNVNFTINKLGQMNVFKIGVNQHFDRETRVNYTITVNCTDKGTPPLSTTETFHVTIIDKNDNPPRFEKSYYEESILENNRPGSVILRVYANDTDTGENSDLTFKIEPFPESSKFIIEPKTGIIKANGSFDRETENNTYRFTVKVSDNGKQPLSDQTRVTINIMDENDNPPSFNGDSYSMSVLENSNVSKTIGQITAHDPDLGENGRVSFKIPSNYSSLPFAILDDGTMITTEILDHEDESQYLLEVVAYDHGNPQQQKSIPVFVTVKDENDNAPIIDFPKGENSTVTIPNSATINQTLTTILAHDVDAKENQKLLYAILSGNDEEMFGINQDTGDIYLLKKVGNGDVMHYILMISVRDNGENQFETSATLHIEFYVSNEAVPVATAGGQNILIVVIISCVTFVLSVIIIIIIAIICRKDRKRRLYTHKPNDQMKIMDSNNRSSTRSSSSKGSQDKMLFPEQSYTDGFYQQKKKGKEVSFSFEEEQDAGISMSTNGQFDPVSTFKSPSPEPSIQSDMYKQQVRVETPPPPKPERSEDKKQREIYRMTSLKVHQALIKTNNNNNNKPWPQPANDEMNKAYIGLTTRNHLDDCHSETSGETTTSDSGRGGSEEDIRSNITGSHEADESRSPNTSTSHPFYTAESHQPTFSSFRGNGVHRSGPILSSFLSKGNNFNKNPHETTYQNSFPLNDLSNSSKKSASDNHSHRYSDINLPTNFNESGTFTPGFGLGLSKLDIDPTQGSHPSNLDIRNSLENGSITARSQDDDNTTTTSGSYTINDLQDDLIAVQGDMFYKPDTFV